MSLTNEQRSTIAIALATAIPTRQELERIASHGLGNSFNALPADARLSDLAAKLVETASAQPDGISRLIAAAREARPADANLAEIARPMGLAPEDPEADPDKGSLERAVDPLSSLMDYAAYLSRASRLQTQICLVELRGSAWGTGFLVGPDLVLTNYHVAEPLIKKGATPADITLLFDYLQDSNGAVVNGGVRYALADPGWCIDDSPYHPDEAKGSAAVDPNQNQLDYALLRVDGTPGMAPVGGQLGPPRGWVVPRAGDYPFPEGDVLRIAQHPRGAPLKIAEGAVIAVNANLTRVTYNASTERGSSGSPVLNRDWEVVALHHHGSKTHNQGVPISSIRRLLTERGYGSLLDNPPPSWSTPPSPTTLPQPEPNADEEAPAVADDTTPAEWTATALLELDEALRAAFRRDGLERLLAFRLDTDLAEIVPNGGTFRQEVKAVVDWAEAENKIEDLVRLGRVDNPGNLKLKAWEARYLPAQK